MKQLLLILGVSISFLTSGQISTLPYNQSFDGAEIPEFWTQENHLVNSQIWQFGTDGSSGKFWSPSPVLDESYAILNSEAYGEGQQQNVDLISPTFDLTAYSNINIRFTHFFYYVDQSAATLSYSIDNGTNWTEIRKWEEISSNPEVFNQALPAVANQSQVKFKWNYVGEYGWGWAFDDFSINVISAAFWTGNDSEDWNDPDNWLPAVVPDANTEVYIPLTSRNPEILQVPPAECYQLTIIAGSKLTIKPGLSLTVYGSFINNNTNGLLIQSDEFGTGSFIAGTVIGDGSAQIERYMAQNQWHNISSPVNQTISTFLENNDDIPTKDVTSRGMMDYSPVLDNWNAYFTNSTTGNLGGGKGYSIRTSSDTYVTFNGTLTAGAVDIPIYEAGYGWNLVGNPYTSAIKLNYFSGNNSFLSINENVLDPNYVSIYVWDGTQYEIINNVQGPAIGAVCQGFFVKTDIGGNITFKPEMQVHRPTALLKSAIVIPGIKLQATTSTKKSSTDIKFYSKGTTGLDKGYDAGTFKSDPTFSLFTKLVDDNNVDFGIQCLPELSAETMVIPVGIDFPEGGEVTFNAQMLSIPENSSIVLEDRLLNTTTAFTDAKNQYTTTVAANSMPTGRFYLHVSNITTEIGDISSSSDFNAFYANEKIVINGNIQGNGNATVFDMMGRKVKEVQLERKRMNTISTVGMKNGIYILNIQHEGGVFTKKIPLNR